MSLLILGGNVEISTPVSVAEVIDEMDTEEGVFDGDGILMDVEEPVTDTEGGLPTEADEAEHAVEGGLLMEVVEPARQKGGGLSAVNDELKETTVEDWDFLTGGGLVMEAEESDFLMCSGLVASATAPESAPGG